MDLLRSCYKGYMDFGDGAPNPYLVTWYFIDDTAPCMDFPHLFGSRNWDPQGLAMVGPGEPQNTPQIYYRGQLPSTTPPAGKPCGDLSWFVNGVPPGTPPLQLNSENVPICCFGGFPPPPSCIPWNFFLLETKRSAIDLTIGQYWDLILQTQGELSYLDPVFSADLVEFQGHSLPACAGHFSTTARITINSAGPSVLVHMVNVEWDPTTNTSLWQIPATAPRYAGDIWQLVSPLS